MHRRARFAFAVPVLLAAVQFVPAFAQDTATETPPAPLTETVALQVKLEKDARYRHVSETRLDQTIMMGGSPMSTIFELNTVFDQHVLGPNEAGGADVKATQGRITGKLESPMLGSVAFDSSKASTESGNPMIDGMVKGMTAMSGASLDLTVDPTGKVTDVRGVEALVERMTEINPMAAMQPGVADELKQSFTSLYPQLPSEPVGVGSKWSATRTQGMQGATMTVKVEFEVTAITADEVVAKGTISTTTEGAIMGGMAGLGDGTGTVSASFARKDGLIIEQTTVMEMGLDMSAMTGEPGGGEMKLTSTVKRVDAPAGDDKPVTGEGGDGETPQPEGE